MLTLCNHWHHSQIQVFEEVNEDDILYYPQLSKDEFLYSDINKTFLRWPVIGVSLEIPKVDCCSFLTSCIYHFLSHASLYHWKNYFFIFWNNSTFEMQWKVSYTLKLTKNFFFINLKGWIKHFAIKESLFWCGFYLAITILLSSIWLNWKTTSVSFEMSSLYWGLSKKVPELLRHPPQWPGRDHFDLFWKKW